MNHALQRPGEVNGRAKLTAPEVDAIHIAVRQRDVLRSQAKRLADEARKIREQARALSNKALARRYGLTERGLAMVVYRQTWQHIR